MIIKGLISNIAFLIVLSYIYSFLYRSQYKINKLIYKIITGFLFGLIAIAGMVVPLHFAPGIIFDGRSIILCIAGLFGGGVVAVISVIITGIYRYLIGGNGTYVGIAVIMTSGLIGVIYRYLFKKPSSRKFLYLYFFGVVVHLFMMLWMLALPDSVWLEVIRKLSLPVLLVYPLATVLVAKMLIDQEKYNNSLMKLVENEIWLRKIIDNNPHFIFIRDEDGIYQTVNKAMAETYGMSPQEIEGKKDTDFISSEADSTRHKNQDLKIFSGESKRLVIESSFIDSKGNTRFMYTIKVPFDLLTSGKKAVLGVSSDVTELRRIDAELTQKNAILEREIDNRLEAEHSLKESERQLRFILENSTNLFYAHTTDHVLTFVSQQSKTILGYEPEELMIKWAEISSDNPVNVTGFNNTMKAIETGEPQQTYELELIRKDGRQIMVEVREAPVVENGQTIAIVGALTDISARKQAEEKVLEYQQSLEEMIELRTENLLEKTASYEDSQRALSYLMEDVNEARFELEKVNAEMTILNQELESFSYSISHDLRAPLRAIDGFSKLIEEDYYDKLDDEGKENIEIIRNNAQMMGTLINDLLEFSRLSRKDFKFHEIDMNEIVKEQINELKQANRERNIKFKLRKLPNVKADKSMMKQVMQNLLSNAVKYSQIREEAIIECGWQKRDEETVFFIKDNGVGFNMKYVGKLFGVFQRLHSSKEFEGTGVGLAIVQRIINKHGGNVWAEAEVDQGATFYFSLPN
jgi:PAS domain S-box-containing protein